MKAIIIYFCCFIMLMSCSNKEQEKTNIVKKTVIGETNDTSFDINAPMVKISGGKYFPLYGRDGQWVKIKPFYIDILPVTNADYLAFVKTNKRWQKSNTKKIFADNNYLADWKNDTIFGTEMNNSAVTNISWFAAKAYCQCQGKRLPLVDEWEYVAMANKNKADARKIESFNQSILNWYEKSKTSNHLVGQNDKNYWGVYDLHELVWEWTYDFNSIILPEGNQKNAKSNKNLFCGSDSISATGLMNYAAFMRYAFRASLKANYTLKNLGFRCVKDSINNSEYVK